ncbi:MAG: phosphoribosylformylglycinamidine synthase, partial [Bilophila sp.]
MLYRIEAGLFPHLDDTIGRKTAAGIRAALGIDVTGVRVVKVFTLDGFTAAQVETLLSLSVLHDPVLQVVSLQPLPLNEIGADWIVEVGYRPGVTDNEARTARDTAALVLHLEDRNTVSVYTSVQYRITGQLTAQDVSRIAKDLLANELIQRFEIKSQAEWNKTPGFTAKAARVTGSASDEVNIVPLSGMDDAELMQVSHSNTLALSLAEMVSIKNWFGSKAVAESRKAQHLPADPTDAELEVLAQTWSEHCKHKIFASRIKYKDLEAGTSETINNLYKSCIQQTTKTIREQRGANDFCRSVFKDNAGVIAFNATHDACIKVETHNSPSALDPYGGALTGIVGVNRDPMGTGLGAELICNTDVFCFASPFHT